MCLTFRKLLYNNRSLSSVNDFQNHVYAYRHKVWWVSETTFIWQNAIHDKNKINHFDERIKTRFFSFLIILTAGCKWCVPRFRFKNNTLHNLSNIMHPYQSSWWQKSDVKKCIETTKYIWQRSNVLLNTRCYLNINSKLFERHGR